MEWNIKQAAENGTLAHVCVDHQRLYNDACTIKGQAEFKTYSKQLCTFNAAMDVDPRIMSISVWLLHLYKNLEYPKEQAKIAKWYDSENFAVTDKCAYDAYNKTLDKRLPLIQDFNTNSHLCIKNQGSCFAGTDLLEFLKAKGKTHLLFTGGWLNVCVAQSINDALKDDAISVGIIRDLTLPSRYYKEGRLAHLGYHQAVEKLCSDRVMITTQAKVMHALDSSPIPLIRHTAMLA